MISHSHRLLYTLVTGLFLLTLGGCGEPKWNSDYNLNQAQLKQNPDSAALASADTTKPDITASSMLKDVEKKEKEEAKETQPLFSG